PAEMNGEGDADGRQCDIGLDGGVAEIGRHQLAQVHAAEIVRAGLPEAAGCQRLPSSTAATRDERAECSCRRPPSQVRKSEKREVIQSVTMRSRDAAPGR